MTLYKLTRSDGTTYGGYQWILPTEEGPCEWHEVDGELQECANGLHCCTAEQLPLWFNLYGTDDLRLFEVEADGEVLDAGDKRVARRLRLVRDVGTLDARKLREFACDCAERVLPYFEDRFPDDGRPRAAIDTSRRYARGEASNEELNAAWSEAWSAASAAYAAARSAAAAAHAAYAAARPAAYAAARSAAAAAHAAYAAARPAESAAARSAESAAADAAYAAARPEAAKWQGARLLQIASE